MLIRHRRTSPWFASFGRRATPVARVIALPYAGGVCTALRSWPRILREDVELLPVQLLGRGARCGEPPMHDVRVVAMALADALEPALDLPYVVFGHCMGSIVGLELVRTLRDRGHPEPLALIAGERRGPRLPLEGTCVSELPDAAFLAELEAMDGIPPDVLAREDLVRALLPAVRADFRICERYRYEPRPTLSCAVHAVGGTGDDVTPEQLDAWALESTGPFTRSWVDAGHFFLDDAATDIVAIVESHLMSAGVST